uniref:Uncharacterized protein n=1 Tax=Odontella aurita TaxID=265563 RepID=A0A7S4JQE0_9STRA|mmetsp:Transcript_51782/g.155391  ORF Transcript_51782/g.155391 Transcript_51782/m.155391 type:complete len:313 (+) Transcript_51782:250-1188(+)
MSNADPRPMSSDIPQCITHTVMKCVADAERLFRVRCTKCDYVRDFSQDDVGAAKYLYHRRRTRAAQGLLSVGAPLNAASATFLCQTSAECGIISNTNSPHVSFVEGLVPNVDHTGAVRQLRDNLFHNPTITVVGVHRVSRRDNVTDLILADVILTPGANYAVHQLADSRICKLPQFPFHVALGACPRAGSGSKRAAAWAETRLRGMNLAVDPSRLRVLPPPEGSRRKAHQRRRGEHQRHQKQQGRHEQPQDHRGGHGHKSVFNGDAQKASSSGSPEAETDETDAVSMSTSSSSPVEQKAQYPGLVVDLTFLD